MSAADLERAITLDAEAGGLRRDDFFQRRWRAMQSNPRSYPGLVAVAGDSVVGFALGHVLTGEFGGTRPLAIIDSIAVDPGVRGGGVGRSLLEALKTAARELDCAEIRTVADWERQDLLGFFAATGFTPAPLAVIDKSLEAN